jgi:hypothetical protein
MEMLVTNPPVSRNGHSAPVAPTTDFETSLHPSLGRFACFVAHLETGLMLAIPLAPVVATFLTVLMYIDLPESNIWQTLTSSVPAVVLFPLIVLVSWLALAIPLTLTRLGTPDRANSSSYAHLTSRLLTIEAFRNPADAAREGAPALDPALCRQLDFIRGTLNSVGPKWILGDGFVGLWRLVDRLDAALNYLMPRDRVWSRAQALLIWLPNPSSPHSGVPDPRAQLNAAIEALGKETPPDAWTEVSQRGMVAQIQTLIDSSKTDRYAGFVRARNMLLASCTMTALALYAIFWLGIVALPPDISRQILSSALFFTTIGALVGLFQLLYVESKSETGVDDYGLSVARLIVAPQLAALAALVGVVLTSLATSALSGSPTSTAQAPTSIPEALNQIRNPANVLVAVAFALSPGLVFSRFRENIEQNKQDLSKSTSASIVQSKTGS